MISLTPPERRGALVVVVLLLLGTAYDRWRVHFAGPLPPFAESTTATGHDPDSAVRPAPVAPDSSAGGPPGAQLDLNRASAQELDALPGIGPVLAERIVQHRQQNGAFRRVEDLAAVRGIGPRAIARLRGALTVHAP